MVEVLDLYCGAGGLSLGFALAREAEILGLEVRNVTADEWPIPYFYRAF